MEVQFATLSIHKFVNSIGADVGFAAFICVAVMGLLYFAQARETATLRERLEDAHERIGGLEARIAQLMHMQSTRQPVRQQPPPAAGPARVTPPPAAARPVASAIPSVRRIPSATASVVTPGHATALPAAPLGVGAPALASATKLIPDPVLPAGAAAPDDTIVVPGPALPASNGRSERPASVPPAAGGSTPPAAPRPATPPAAGSASPAAGDPATPAAAASTHPTVGEPTSRAASADPTSPAATADQTPPRVQIEPEGASGASAPRRIGQTSTRPLGEARFDVFELDRAGSRTGLTGSRLPVAIAIVAVLVIVGGAVAIWQSGNGSSSSPAGSSHHTPLATVGGGQKGSKHKAAPFSAANVTVAVLNGTAVNGLAADVSKLLSAAGYKKGSITNAASQTQPTTSVYFMPHHKLDAQHVARQLKLTSAVLPATQSVIQSCATTPSSTTTSCSGNVIVSVGQDKASLAGASSSAG